MDDEIGCCTRDRLQLGTSRDIYSFVQNFSLDLFVGVSCVRPVLEEEFIGDDADGIVVDREIVVETLNDFWSHIGKSSSVVVSVVFLVKGGYSEVGDVRQALVVNHDVFGLYVPVDYVFAVDVPYDFQ